MAIAALITWLITAVGGFVLLGTWLSRGGARSTPATATAGAGAGAATGGAAAGPAAPTKLPPSLVFGHFLLAVAGLVVWIIYLANDNDTLAWVAFIIVAVVALFGLSMLARWIAAGAHRRGDPSAPDRPETHFPLAVVAGHGVFAVATVVLVLLAALEIGGD